MLYTLPILQAKGGIFLPRQKRWYGMIFNFPQTIGATMRERRFAGIARLYGTPALERLRHTCVCVAGVGGVGSWTVEALARSGVGELILIDPDHVSESNINRQIHALQPTLGASKAQLMAERAQAINPDIRVTLVEDFVTQDNAADLLQGADIVVDAVDQVLAKVGIVLACRERRIPFILSGAAGGKKDPGNVCLNDLARTEHDALLAKVRRRLRALHAFPRELRVPFQIPAIFCQESAQRPSAANTHQAESLQGLSCSGYGSSMAVTATMGLRAAAWVLEAIQAPVTAANENKLITDP